jgi:hypothetical protein
METLAGEIRADSLRRKITEIEKDLQAKQSIGEGDSAAGDLAP